MKISNTTGITSQKVKFQEDFWLQFDLECLPGSPGGPFLEGKNLPFLGFRFSGAAGPNVSFSPIETRLDRDSLSGRTALVFRIRPFQAAAHIKEISLALDPDQNNCVESHFTFLASDSLVFEARANNRRPETLRLPFIHRREYLELQMANQGKGPSPAFFLRNFILSPVRKRAVPLPPRGLATRLDSTSIPVFTCATAPTACQEEFLQAAQWRLFLNGSSFPLFDEVTRDPARFNERALPLELDSGLYRWQVRHQNNFSNWGHWSSPEAFRISRAKPPFFEIDSLFITKPGNSAPLSILKTNGWAVLHLLVNPAGRPWKDFGYAIAWLSGRDYTEGNAANKGGCFSARNNYVLNLSSDLAGDSPIIETFEKKTENSFTSDLLPRGTRGLYYDSDTTATLIDTARNEITFKFRLLKEAEPGPWRVSAYTAGTREIFSARSRETVSNVRTFSILVRPESRLRPRPLLLAALIVSAACLLIWRNRRKRAAIVSSDKSREDFERLVAHIREHLADENLTMAVIRQSLSFPRDYVYELIRDNRAESLPQLINKLRIEKAQALLKDPAKNISDVGYEVGFSEPRYFSKIFKAQTGLTPSEFRERG